MTGYHRLSDLPYHCVRVCKAQNFSPHEYRMKMTIYISLNLICSTIVTFHKQLNLVASIQIDVGSGGCGDKISMSSGPTFKNGHQHVFGEQQGSPKSRVSMGLAHFAEQRLQIP